MPDPCPQPGDDRARSRRCAVRVRVASSPEPAAAARSASQTLPVAGRGELPDLLHGPLADAPTGHVEDALEGRHVVVVAQRAQVRQRVLDLAPLVEAGAADQLVAQAVAQERLLDGPALGVGAVHDRDVLEPVRRGRRRRPRDAPGPNPPTPRPATSASTWRAIHSASSSSRSASKRSMSTPARVLGPQLLVLAVLVAGHDRVRGVEDELRGAVVLLQLDHRGVRVVALEVEDVAQVRAAPGVDALVVVAHHGQVAVPLGELADPQVLRPVGVLVLVDVQVAPALLVVGEHRGRLVEQAHRLVEQVVEVERARRP